MDGGADSRRAVVCDVQSAHRPQHPLLACDDGFGRAAYAALVPLGRQSLPGALGCFIYYGLGVGLSVGLWCFFWLGDKVSQLLFSFARPQVDAIYDMGSSFPRWAIALLLLFVIGPAEELFWRGFVQRRMAERWGAWGGFAVATLCYTLVHVWSGNLMLLLAAAACGFCWGLLYCLLPKRLPALILSHALWDAAAFVFFPF